MRVKLAGTAGFCAGVKRALDLIDRAATDGTKVSTLGPLVHSGAILENLTGRGVRALDRPELVEKGSAVAPRPHGALRKDEEALRARGARLLETVCPHIDRTREAIRRLSDRGVNVVLAANPQHGETAVLKEQAKTRVWIVSSTDEAQTVPAQDPVALVGQSTFLSAVFEDIAETLRERFPQIEVLRETMCGATDERQAETRRLAQHADALVIVGPYHSNISRRLAEIGRESGKQTFHVESAEDLPVETILEQARLCRQAAYLEEHAGDPPALQAATDSPEIVDREVVIGVTAGASTPSWVTRAVVDRIVEACGAELVVTESRVPGSTV